jgi:type IV pilus assembly protein PilW
VKQRGMTLVELMVAMAVGLGITLAVTSLLISSQNNKRTTTSTNDAEQTGTYAFYALDKVLRGAGSAIAESAYPTDRGVLGCKLNAAQILPRTTPFPAPFAGFLSGVTNTLVVAPVLIGQNQSLGGSDVLAVMGGSGAAGGVSRQVSGGGSSTSLTLDNTVGFATADVGLVSQSGVVDCLLEEINTISAPMVTVSGTTYYTQNGTTTDLANLAASTSTYYTPIGNATANNVQFMLFGVDNNRTLYSYDLLQNLNKVQGIGGDVAQAIADGVVQLNALYGLDTNGDGIQDTWASPGDTGWDINTVMASPAKMREVISVRVAVVVRNEYYDVGPGGTAAVPVPVSPTTLTIFNGLTNGAGTSLQKTISLSALDQQYRYRIFEFTVPLRNMIILAGA